jgi:hypothetical protein
MSLQGKTDDMPLQKRAFFYLRGEDSQQHGIRLILTSKLIKRHFKRASVWDDPNGIQTEVLLEGTEEDIMGFYREVKDHLIDWINERNMDLGIAKQISKNPGIDIEVTKPDFRDKLKVHELGLFGHCLTFDEVSKGYNVFLDNIQTNKRLNETLDKLSDVLDKKLGD